MIRVQKISQEPAALKTDYNHPDVCKQILEDQNDKCYICEQRLVTNYQIEHLKSRHNYPLLAKSWSNLFVACSYCNGRKSDKYDTILNPAEHNIEEIINHSNDFSNKTVLFTSTDTSIEVNETIDLLSRLFNGKSKVGRDFKEKRFYEEFVMKLNVFLRMVNTYLSGNHSYMKAIDEQLREESELLGFKYYIIKSNKVLNDNFGHLVVWNKI